MTRRKHPEIERVDPYSTFEETGAAARRLGIRNGAEYKRRHLEDRRLPSSPWVAFREVWRPRDGWNGLLGTHLPQPRRKDDCYPTWDEGAAAARAMGIRDSKHYLEVYRRDDRLPSRPDLIYADVWEERGGMRGFLGKLRPRCETFDEGAAVTQALGIQSAEEYRRRYTEDSRLYAAPNMVYPDWLERGSWKAYLGLKGVYPTWEEAAAAVRALGIRSTKVYFKRHGEDPRLPAKPHEVYADVWEARGGWPGFFGTSTPRLKKREQFYPDFERASAGTIALGIRTVEEYAARYSEDERLPMKPYRTYRDQWVPKGGWNVFLGLATPNVKKRHEFYSTYREAALAAQGLDIRTSIEYQERYREDERLPCQPEKIYAPEWRENDSWPGFLGVPRRSGGPYGFFYPCLADAAKAAQRLGIKSSADYRRRRKEDFRLPVDPEVMYGREWRQTSGWPYFLGRQRLSSATRRRT